ncbi:MAG: sodium:solute symporter family protein, partial [Jatrophihabitantaceae bacterium]
TWFLLGGDLYTAYTFVAVPALVYGAGAIGFFAVPYTIIVYPLVFVVMPRLWSVAHRHGYVTPADFVRGRFDSPGLALAVAITGIVAMMPYIALQLVGIQAVLDTIGLGGTGNAFVRDLPLIIAFAVLAAYSYSSGLRAPALIAFVKDILIYLVIIVAVVYVAVKIGYGHVFDAAQAKLTAVSPKTHKLMLGLLALLGFAAIAKKTSILGLDGKPNAQLAVPHFFAQVFPSWFAGVAFAAIAIGALVPAAIMSIAAANLFTRNIYRDFLRPSATPREQARVSKLASLVVKFGALAFVLFLGRQNALNFQLLGGVWIMQTFLAIVAGLYTRWLHRWALLLGWLTAMVYGTWSAYDQASPTTSHFGSSLADFPFTGTKVYIAVSALVINIVVSVVLTVLFGLLRVPAGTDETAAADFYSDETSPTVAAEAQATLAGQEGQRP